MRYPAGLLLLANQVEAGRQRLALLNNGKRDDGELALSGLERDISCPVSLSTLRDYRYFADHEHKPNQALPRCAALPW